MNIYIIPITFLIILLIALFKNLPGYNIFAKGANESTTLCIKTFPFLVDIFIMIELLKTSGVMDFIISNTTFFWNFLHIPKEIANLIILRPFSGSGSLAILTEIYAKYGTNSYISNCASVIMNSSDTLFYILAVYFSQTKIKKTGLIIPIALISTLIGNIFACIICMMI